MRPEGPVRVSCPPGLLAERLLAHTLPKAEWTHAAHLAATLYLLAERPDLDLDNLAVGTPNTEHGGYHETLTRFYLRLLRHVLARAEPGAPLTEVCAALLASPEGDPAYPLRFYGRALLDSPRARASFVPPDRAPLPF